MELRPFDYHYTKEEIIESWLAVGFLPMTGKAAEDPKVRHELGEGGAPPTAARCLCVCVCMCVCCKASGYGGCPVKHAIPIASIPPNDIPSIP